MTPSEVTILKNGQPTDWQETILKDITSGRAFLVPYASKEVEPNANYTLRTSAKFNNQDIGPPTAGPAIITHGQPTADIHVQMDAATVCDK